MSVDDEVLKEFLLESSENLNQLDRDFVALEKDPNDRERLGAIFRCVHTIKGTSGFLAFSKLESLTHAGEAILSRLRDGDLTLNAEITSALLAMVDAVRRMLASIESTGAEGEESHTHIHADLARAAGTETKAAPAPAAPPPPPPPAPIAALPTVVQTVPEQSTLSAMRAAAAQPQKQASEAEAAHARVADTTIRVDVGLLDKVMNLVGELVLARNQIIQFSSTIKDQSFLSASQRLNLLTTELQEGVMKTRMQPIGNVWGKFPRVVRDLAHACGKKVNLELDGAETELDRTIIEAIKDPLTHAVRNAVDHGLEAPERRRALGKSEAGRILLRAFHEGGQVNIEVSDDGAGLDLERIRSRAVERGLVAADAATRLTEREVMHLIFAPGFSTAAKITNVSGRGVGMDVVKTNIEKIGGTVDVVTRPGQGTTLKIKIPLTLAIIPALIVTSRFERYAIPQVNLLELVRLEGDQAKTALESLHGTSVYRLRGNLLPIVFLNRALGMPDDAGAEADAINIIVLQADDRQFGLVVDSISDTEEIVVKPLGKELKGISAFAGATIMGDGRIALILDVLGIAQASNVISAARDRGHHKESNEAEASSDDRETLLLFRVGSAGRMAIPLSMVARLEEIARDDIERAGGRDVIQYRGAILPLIDLARATGRQRANETASLQVIVYSEDDKSVGFVVDQIIDIVEETLTVRQRIERDGVASAAVVQGRVTDILDVHGVIRTQDPGFFTRKKAA